MAAVWDAAQRTWTITTRSSSAVAISVVVVDRERPFQTAAVVPMQRVADVWTAIIASSDVDDAELYGFRVVEGSRPDHGRFDATKDLLDPEATRVWFPRRHDRALARIHGAPTLGRSPLAVLPTGAAPRARPLDGPRRPAGQLIIYEVHVRGATMLAEDVPAEQRGTFAGLQHLVGHLVSLGVTAVELLPVHQFDPDEGNYWGYMPLAWSALHSGYVARGDADADAEFVAMVDAFHTAGIEVILDVVYNHTTEEDDLGPTYHLRGLDDAAFYVLHPDGSYRDDAGCGNVVRAAHPAAADMILASLTRFADLGVDGFRFDLASLLGRDIDGNVQATSALIDAITDLARRRDLRLIAEAWDLTAYQLGDVFPGRTWAQWNGRFRDACRSFLRAEAASAAAMAVAIDGSPDLFGGDASRSINFVTAHDGFTLYDLVSYERKHNDANGQNGVDGTDDNRSWNCGWEGDDVPAELAGGVRALRLQQMKNAMVLLVLSAGAAMILAGDEFGQTQHGNNNPYNQDNATTWLDWERRSAFADVTAFVSQLIRLRSGPGSGAVTGIVTTPFSIAWRRGDVYVMANPHWDDASFDVPADGPWQVALSSAPPPPTVTDGRVTLAPRSTAVLTRDRAPAGGS